MVKQLWLPKETRSYTPLETTIPMSPMPMISTSLNAPTASQTAPGPKSQPNFNMLDASQLPFQFPRDWPTRFATKH